MFILRSFVCHRQSGIIDGCDLCQFIKRLSYDYENTECHKSFECNLNDELYSGQNLYEA